MCNCRRNRGYAGATTTGGAVIAGYEVTYTDGTKAPNLFDSLPDARRHARLKGGTVKVITR